jgi:hypothetical protein
VAGHLTLTGWVPVPRLVSNHSDTLNVQMIVQKAIALSQCILLECCKPCCAAEEKASWTSRAMTGDGKDHVLNTMESSRVAMSA